ncbi:MAG: glycosyltransferase family 2 protein [Ignavibacteriae bacterium]|nr:glycosyltransferase family 2 protein [Ignavibacteriota bacterium]
MNLELTKTELKNTKILVAVISYNEEKSIKKVYDDLNENNFGYDILIVENGSYDNTSEICRINNIPYIRHCINDDINGTWKSYLLYAYLNNYDIVCQFDGDGQHKAVEIHKIIEPIIKGEANQVIGSRFLNNKGFQSYMFRRMGINLFSFLISLIIGYKIKDVTSGFIAFDRNIINFFSRYYKNEINDPNQTHLLSHFSGAKIKEVAVEMRERQHGKSLYNIFNAFLYPIYGMVNIAGCLLIKKQIQKEWRKNHEL